MISYFFNYKTMWRGPVVQARKNAVNAVKGKVFSLHAKLIALAAQSGWNPDDNPSLAAAITKAKKEWVPNDNIDRAIRHIFSKMSGNMWESGSVWWMFKRKGLIIVNITKHSSDIIEELLMETEAEDYTIEWDYIEIISAPEMLWDIQNFLESSDISIDMAEIDYIPDTEVEVTEFDSALKITKMIQSFEEDEDVSWVYSNGNISPKLQKEVDEFIEKNTFKT